MAEDKKTPAEDVKAPEARANQDHSQTAPTDNRVKSENRYSFRDWASI